ncbi:MAG: response regulator [Planctomycetes bacterium]|nr:response regulator [Planctomycetota bacterium]
MAKILVVDDDGDLVAAISTVLEGKGYEVATASNKEEGMAKIKEIKPDLAILDVMMTTWQDGFEMAREVKGDEGLKNIPILMLTGVGDKTGMDRKSETGDAEWLPVDAFLDKPVKSDVLLAEVERLLS